MASGMARYVVDAVELEKRSMAEVARSTGRSVGWVHKMVHRYRQGGYEALAPGSKSHQALNRTPSAVEDAVVDLRKELTDLGLDAGAHSIRYHLSSRVGVVPSVSTIWRILKRRGFIESQPRKKPRSAWLRFESELPNETWQADVTHWQLADGSVIEILDFIDDHSRVVVGAKVQQVFKAQDVADAFHENAANWGYPASCLTDNGAIFTARSRKGRVTFETHLEKLGIDYKHSRPYHPQTCGKIERFHQTLKKHLSTRPKAQTIKELQTQIDWFVNYYNTIRPHRACGSKPPIKRFEARDKASPETPIAKRHLRVRTDKISSGGHVTLRHDSKLYKIGIGRPYAGTKVRLYINDLDIRVVTTEGELLRHLKLDTTRRYQPQNGW